MSYATSISRVVAASPLSGFWHPGLETHIEPKEAPYGNNVFTLRFPSDRHSIDDQPAFSVIELADRIGANGWDYQNQTAEFVVFESDFEHGTNAQTLDQLEANDAALRGRATIHTSTGGSGRHYRVRFATPVPCPTRSIYNDLCRYVAHELGMTDKTCARGGYLWIWAEGSTGFRLISEQTIPFDLPADWAPPVQRMRIGHKTVELIDRHDRVLNWLADHGHPLFPKPLDGGGGECFATHTRALEACHKALGLLGPFKTCTSSSTQCNCYIVPRDDGGFQVWRYGTAKEPGWNVRQRDERSWCWFNSFDPENDWSALCAANQGVERSGTKKGTYKFANFRLASDVCRAAGSEFVAPGIPDRAISLRFADGAILAEVDQVKGESTPDDWVSMGKLFARSIPVEGTSADRNDNVPIRGVRVAYHYSEIGQQDGQTLIYIDHADGITKPETPERVFAALESEGCHKATIKHWYGVSVRNPYKMSNQPFAKASSDPMVWNRGFQLACDPVPGLHPYWDKVLTHTGRYLDPYVAADPWCQANNIRNGYDYLVVYCAVMVQQPSRRIVQLLLYSPETSTGKNTLTDSLALLMQFGAVIDGTKAVTSESGFNQELEGAVVCTLHEVDLSKSGSMAESRCREWVTSPNLLIHPKGITPYTINNYLRVIQTANDLSYKIVDAQDSRVVVIVLSPIPEDEWLDWNDQLKPALISERAHFLHKLLNYQLPEHGAKGSRCYLPVLDTEAKAQSIEVSLPSLSDDHQQLFDAIMAKVWPEPLDYTSIVTLLKPIPGVDSLSLAPSSVSGWQSAWKKLTPHFKAAGLTPIYRGRLEHRRSALWGFSK